MLGPVTVEPWSAVAKLSPEEKELFWATRKQKVNSTDDDEAESSEDEVPHYDSKEDGTIPVSFHTLSPAFAEEQIHSTRAGNVIDVFPGQGDIAIACLNMGVGCFCICHSEKQRELIMERLENRAAELACQITSSFYNPVYAKLAGEIPATAANKTTISVPTKRKAKTRKPIEPVVDSKDNSDGSAVGSDDDSDTDNDGDPDGQEDPPRKRPKKDGAAATQTTVDLKGIMKDARKQAGKPKSVTFA